MQSAQFLRKEKVRIDQLEVSMYCQGREDLVCHQQYGPLTCAHLLQYNVLRLQLRAQDDVQRCSHGRTNTLWQQHGNVHTGLCTSSMHLLELNHSTELTKRKLRSKVNENLIELLLRGNSVVAGRSVQGIEGLTNLIWCVAYRICLSQTLNVDVV